MPTLANLSQRVPWLPFVLPLAVFMLVGMLEPSPAGGGAAEWLGLGMEHYPTIYYVKIGLVLAVLAQLWPAYRQFPFGITPLAIVVGLTGGAGWILLCRANLEEHVFQAVGLESWLGSGARTAYDPFAALGENPAALYAFLTVRLVGLALVVPIIEELFLRAFVIRFVTAPEWEKVPFGDASRMALVVGTVLPVLTHPASELFAVVAWFSLVTWLMVKTRNLWDCVVAHAITNAMLGGYVVWTRDWELW